LNLIITCPRNLETEAFDEIKNILYELGDESPTITITELSGILTVTTQLDTLYIIKKIREKINLEPWSIRYCYRLIPIQNTISSEIKSITTAILKLANIIKPENSFRITIEKRNSNLSTKMIISEIAKNFQNKVSLENPDWIVLVEIIGNVTGVSVLKKDSILSVQKIKRELSD